MSRLGALLAVGAVSFAAAGGCGTDPSRYDEVESWQCFEDASRCDCRGAPEGTAVTDSRPRVVTCRAALDCCFVKQRSDGTYDCRCLVAPPREGGAGGEGGEGDASPELLCAAAAIEYGSTEVVPRCPPVTLNDSAVCALAFESCDPEFLERNGLIACCMGTSCRKDQYGMDVCQPG